MAIADNVHHIALQLIARHGADARAFAAAKADAMLAGGKLYERRTWHRVQDEIDAVLARDLLGDFPGLCCDPFPDLAGRDETPIAILSDAFTTWPLSTKWMLS